MRPVKIYVGAALVLAAIVLTGCVVKRDYTGPQTGSAAYISVTSSTGDDIAAQTFDKAENCESRRFITPDQFKRTITARNGRTLSFAAIDAGQPLSIGAQQTFPDSGTTVNYCMPIVNFTPQPGRYYSLVLARADDGCHGVLFSTDDPASGVFKREGFRKMIFSGGFDENSSFCTAGENITPEDHK